MLDDIADVSGSDVPFCRRISERVAFSKAFVAEFVVDVAVVGDGVDVFPTIIHQYQMVNRPINEQVRKYLEY